MRREIISQLIETHVVESYDDQPLARTVQSIAEHALRGFAVSRAGGLSHRSAVDVELRPPRRRKRAVAASLLIEHPACPPRAIRATAFRARHCCGGRVHTAPPSMLLHA